jgi:hypothetical protein
VRRSDAVACAAQAEAQRNTLREFGEMAQEDETGQTLAAPVTDDDAEDQGRP